MKFSPIQINIFKNLIKESKYRGSHKRVGRPKVKNYVELFKCILFKIKTGVKFEIFDFKRSDTKLYGNFSA